MSGSVRSRDAWRSTHEPWPRGGRPTELRRMTSKQLQGYSKKELAELARKKGIAGWHGMRKEELIEALASARAKAARSANGTHHANGHAKLKLKVKSKHRARPQLGAARNTGNGISAEETVER